MYERVICIGLTTHKSDDGNSWPGRIIPGDNYHVTKIETFAGRTFYELAERGSQMTYTSEAFLLCSELDEMVLINHPIKRKK